MKEKEIELRSEEFQEILGTIPPWIQRWGITVVFVIVTIILTGSSIFKYPDIISASMTLTGTTPPASIIARMQGKLTELNVKDNQFVKKGDYLAVIENSSKTADILFLKNYLNQINNNPDSIRSFPPKKMELGNMQSLYSSFYMALFEYSEFLRLKYYPQKINMMKNRINQYESYYKILNRQSEIVGKQLTITKNQFDRDSSLNKSGVISLQDLETSKNQYLQGNLSLENMNTTLKNTEIQITQMKEGLLDNEYQYVEKKNNLETQLKGYITQLLAEIQTWEINYALIAPIDGKITFTTYWAENQNVMAGDNIFNIIPSNTGDFIGKASLPIARSGKAKVGQKVNIHFHNFPDEEFGMVKGTVQNISLIPVNGKENGSASYVVEIELYNGLKTTYKKELPYLPSMEATADIITEDISLLQRFIMPLRKIWKEGMDSQ